METLEGDTWIHWKETRETLEEDTDMECWIWMEGQYENTGGCPKCGKTSGKRRWGHGGRIKGDADRLIIKRNSSGTREIHSKRIQWKDVARGDPDTWRLTRL